MIQEVRKMRKLALVVLLLCTPLFAYAKGARNQTQCAREVVSLNKRVDLKTAKKLCEIYDDGEVNCALWLQRLMATPITPGTNLYPGVPRMPLFGGIHRALQICRQYSVAEIMCADRLVHGPVPYTFFGTFEQALEACKED